MNTPESSQVEKKRQHSPSNTYLCIYLGERMSKTMFPKVSNLPVFHAAQNFWTAGVQILVLSWMVPLGGFYDEY